MFCGSLGVIDALGQGQFSLLIRTIIRKQDQLYFQAGGGITAYSERERELAELEKKCLAFFRMSNSEHLAFREKIIPLRFLKYTDTCRKKSGLIFSGLAQKAA